jgi:hypothetical protein
MAKKTPKKRVPQPLPIVDVPSDEDPPVVEKESFIDEFQ